MQENKQTYGQPRAHRRPENVQRSAATRKTEQTTARPRAAQTNYRFQAEMGRSDPKRPVTSDRSNAGRHPRLDPKEVKKRQKAQRKKAEKERFRASVVEYNERKKGRFLVRQKKEQKRDSVWQKDIVRVYSGVDKVMLVLILTLVCLGTITVFSASYPYALNKGLDMYYYGKRQLIFAILGIVIMLAVSLVPCTFYKHGKIMILAYAGTVVLLLLVLFIGNSEGEAKRWLPLGPFSFQPSEVMKVVLIMMEAWYIDLYKKKIRDRLHGMWYTIRYNVVYPFIFLVIACGLVMLEKHLSGTGIMGILGVAVIVAGGCQFLMNMALYVPGAIGAFIIYIKLNAYALKRITSFTNEDADLLSDVYQTTQGIYAIGSGGLFGLGLGHSRQKYSFVAAAHTDFIFSIWCEEMGFIGAVFLIALYIAFVLRGYTIAARAPDTFSSLTAFGISTHVGLQAFLNICVATDIIPNTGISLPFFSYGGSSLVVLLAEMGILLSISRQYYMKKRDLEELRRDT